MSELSPCRALLAAAAICASAVTSAATPIPQIRGPLADTATQGVLVWDVAGAGYIAEEYLVSGKADVYEPVAMADAGNMLVRNNVHDMGQRDFSLKTLQKDQTFTTRIMVYRPAKAARFSGNVIIETLHPLGGGTAIVWSMLNSFFAANGDAYIAVQHPSTFTGLKATSGSRYGDLAAVDNTQLWGMLAQVGAMVKSGAPASPLHGYAVKHLFMTGYSFTGVSTTTFANWHHAATTLSDGRHVFDGYISNANSMYNRPVDVPVIRINTQSDFNSFGGVANRRDDNDAPGSQYRLYEVVGAPHVTHPVPAAPGVKAPVPPMAGIAVSNLPSLSAAKCSEQYPAGWKPNLFPLQLMLEAAFENMYRWVSDGTAPPHAPRIETNADASTRKDADGNALGGVRLPVIDVPAATYDVGQGDDCFLFGYQVNFSAAKLKARYATKDAYADAVGKSAKSLVQERWLRPRAVEVLVTEAKAVEGF